MDGTKLDPNQVIRREHDEASVSKRVKIVDTELAIAVAAEDGDSVQSVPRVLSQGLTANQELDISLYKELIVEAPGGSTGEYTIDGVNWHTLSFNNAESMPIFASKVRFDQDVYIMVRT